LLRIGFEPLYALYMTKTLNAASRIELLRLNQKYAEVLRLRRAGLHVEARKVEGK
jgi:hypothetical protein